MQLQDSLGVLYWNSELLDRLGFASFSSCIFRYGTFAFSKVKNFEIELDL